MPLATAKPGIAITHFDTDFFHSLRRATIVIIVFWALYILAYFFVVRLLRQPVVKRRREADEARMRLVGSPGMRRAWSMPVSPCTGKTGQLRYQDAQIDNDARVYQAPSCGDDNANNELAQTEMSSLDSINGAASDGLRSEYGYSFGSRSESISRLDRPVKRYSLEFIVAVFSFALVISGISLFPFTLLSLRVIDHQEQPQSGCLTWLSAGLVGLFWQCSWWISITQIFISIPLALMIHESRELRHAPLIRKMALARRRMSSAARQRWLSGFLGALSVLGVVSGGLLGIGAIEPMHVLGPVASALISMLLLAGLLSIVCLPLGILTIFRTIGAMPIRPSHKAGIEQKLAQVEAEIGAIENSSSTSSIASNGRARKRRRSSLSTPLASSSVIGHLSRLRHHAQKLRLELETALSPLTRNLLFVTLLSLSCLMLVLFCGVMLVGFLRYFASEVLWHFPGVQTMDRIVTVLGRWAGLAFPGKTKTLSSRPILLSLSIIGVELSIYAFYILSFWLGFLQLIGFKRPLGLLYSIISAKKYPLDRLLLIEWASLFVVGCTPFIIAHTSLIGEVEMPEGAKFLRLFPSSAANTAPDKEGIRIWSGAMEQLLEPFLSTIIYRFPLIVWIILFYRVALMLAIAFVLLKSLKNLLNNLLHELLYSQTVS